MLRSDEFDPLQEAYDGGMPLDTRRMHSDDSDINGFGASSKDSQFWADAIPGKQGLYDPEYERDACGVGFVANIKGVQSHKIVSDARYLLCNMTHRGAVSSGGNGDGAGILVGIPHEFMKREFRLDSGIEIPAAGQYATGNFFFKKDAPETLEASKRTFESLAESLGLLVIGWRSVPRDSSILGAVALSREPAIFQPLVVLQEAHHEQQPISAQDFKEKFDVKFQTQLYILRKQASSAIGLQNWFYACSLNPRTIVYKGQLTPTQVYQYYHDLTNAHFESHMALVHSRFSTNTFPSWDRAQPLRWIAHNGEINTLRGNKNWMRAREGVMASETFGEQLDKLYPIIEEGGSDSAALDNVLELLVINGALSLPEAIMMMVPEAYHKDMDSNLKAWFDWSACLMEPWDGPALLTFTDGRYCGAMLDRNGLRPCRYYITSDDRVICASEVGVIPVDNSLVVQKGKLKPGDMLLVDTDLGEMVDTKKLKSAFSKKRDYKSWLSKLIKLEDLLVKTQKYIPDSFLSDRHASLKAQQDPRLLAMGYTFEQVSMVLIPMALGSKEALGSMGNDAPLACLNENPVLIYDYFRQLFAQVTNPPIDPIREANVMSLECYVGPQGNLLEVHPSQCDRLLLHSPILQWREFEAIKNIEKAHPAWSVADIDITFEKSQGLLGYTSTIERITHQASEAIEQGKRIIMISDRRMGPDRVPLSSLIAVGAIHHHLIRNKQRSQVALILETGEAREVHHFCVLLGYGCDGIFPYLAMETLVRMNQEDLVRNVENDDIDIDDTTLLENYKHAIDGGILKVMSKMGISTLASYKGAQIFEALGVDNTVVDLCFAGTASRIQGVTFEYIAQDAFSMHERGFPSRFTISKSVNLPESGEYHWRDGGAKHINDPTAIASLQDSVRNKNSNAWEMYVKKEMESIRDCTLRGLLELDFENSESIPLEQVEPWTEIARRFATGAMSYGSISMEAHSTLAVAMNRLGAKSNCGEGGEDAERSIVHSNGDTMRSAIKQVASARFGVTSHYLSDADEIQIKIAQGAKPGEGGELPAHKVSPDIAKTRHSTPYVGLISPPPHHDIYSIEDLKQLIYDLKCSNPRAGISVKLVSEVGVGIVASGVAKAKADHILVSGHDGGTGASRWTGIKYAGLPWELGLAETHQTLVLNDLRRNVVVQTDGQLRTGFDIAVAVLLGAESFTLATVPLIAMGCIMLRKCHLNACAVGIATQDPLLREKFKGQPEHVINFFYYLIQDLRKIMAKLGFRTIDEMVGHSEKLRKRENVNTKAINIDLSPILTPAHVIRPGVATKFTKKQDHRLHTRLDNKLIDEAEITLDRGLPVNIDATIINTDRALGSTLSYRISKKFGEEGLPQDTVVVNIEGSAGQSFGAFLASGITFILDGDANDYVGKGLSGGRLIIRPPPDSRFKSDENVILGNTCFYGATSGTAFISGVAGERFCVRNSGATIVVEKIKGNNAFEYMTGGRAVVLSQMESLNAFSGATGGIAYCLTSDYDDFVGKINTESVELQGLIDPVEIAFVKNLIQEHYNYTKSELAARILGNFNHYLKNFVKVIPTDYKKVLEKDAEEKAKLKQKNTANFLKKFNSGTDLKSDVTNGEVDAIREAKKKAVRNISHKATLAEPKVQDLEDAVNDIEQLEKNGEKIQKTRGFMLYKLRHEKYRHASSRTKDWKELSACVTKKDAKYQTARCMDCGVPFCTSDTGCPISNVIPKFNELVFKNQWKLALDKLLETNNFPEFTGRVCPAPCQGSCTLGIIDDPVGIKSIERLIIDNGFKEGWIQPCPPEVRTGRNIAVIGSGPAGLACADQLNRAGHSVTVYERADRCGGLLMYGIPNMKLDKKIVQRRVDLMAAEGVEFVTSVEIGKDITVEQLKAQNDAVVYAIGSTIPRDLRIPGRDLKNIDFAMSLLTANTKALLSKDLETIRQQISGKKVIVIGGGDTGNDCLGTSVRHGAASVINFELLPQPPNERASDNPWPQWPRVMRVDYGHAEVKAHYGRDPREYCILSKEFIGNEEGEVKAIRTVRVEWKRSESGVWQMVEVPGSEEIYEADVVLLSMGFVGPELFEDPSVVKTKRGTINTVSDASYSVDDGKVFAAGDCRRGQSLIVWAIQEGRKCATSVDSFLMGSTSLPGNGGIVKRDYRLLEELASTVEA